jgi:hypothetical protein
VIEGKMTASAAVKAIDKFESQQCCYCLSKAMLKPSGSSGGISHVLVTNSDGIRERVQKREQ